MGMDGDRTRQSRVCGGVTLGIYHGSGKRDPAIAICADFNPVHGSIDHVGGGLWRFVGVWSCA